MKKKYWGGEIILREIPIPKLSSVIEFVANFAPDDVLGIWAQTGINDHVLEYSPKFFVNWSRWGSTLTGNIHGMPLALLQGLGDRELVNCFYEGAKLDSRNIVIFGAREIEVEERKIMPISSKIFILRSLEVTKHRYINIFMFLNRFITTGAGEFAINYVC